MSTAEDACSKFMIVSPSAKARIKTQLREEAVEPRSRPSNMVAGCAWGGQGNDRSSDNAYFRDDL